MPVGTVPPVRQPVTIRRPHSPLCGASTVGGDRQNVEGMPTDAALPHDVDRRSTSIDEAVAFYERVYDSPDINVGRAVSDGFSWRYRAVGDDEVTVGTSSVGANRWGTVGQGTGYVLAWATAPGLTLDSASRDPCRCSPASR